MCRGRRALPRRGVYERSGTRDVTGLELRGTLVQNTALEDPEWGRRVPSKSGSRRVVRYLIHQEKRPAYRKQSD